MSTGENVKVAVRVRPFYGVRESNMECIVQMSGNVTTIKNPDKPEEEPKSFTFDHSYWSHDGFKEDSNKILHPDTSHPNGHKYCDQKKVFDDLGQGILDNAWDGYNSTLFAYGQTGSGKSYSVIGYEPNVGIVPMFCSELFKGIMNKKAQGDENEYEVTFSMLEIYNEVAQDLLMSKSNKKGLKIRENPKKGFYAEGLSQSLVKDYEEIKLKMDEGQHNRSVAATNMNATSSRAHTIVGINFTQKATNEAGEKSCKTAIINLVDLAGSERADSTKATGDRLKEGAAINQSLTCLGKCIRALAENSAGKSTRVPYRDSALTKLLMRALGGNSKTIMIAAISPSSNNYDESLSTLRYANSAKQIKTMAVVNEDVTEKLLRDLREENDRLKQMMKSGDIDLTAISSDVRGLTDKEKQELRKQWEDEMRARMNDNENQMENLKQTYEEKLRLAQEESKQVEDALKKQEEDRKTKPHLANLNVDPQLSYRLVHFIPEGNSEIGNRKGNVVDIEMVGPGIQEVHAVLEFDGKKNMLTVAPYTEECRILVNGSQISEKTLLNPRDRLVFGTTQIWVYMNPNDEKNRKLKEVIVTYELAQEEIIAKSGVYLSTTDSKDDALLQDDLMGILPGVEEANSISEELDKRVKFEIMLVSPQMMGKQGGRTEVYVRMKNLETGVEYVWPKDKFLSRLYIMKEMFSNYETEDSWDVPKEQDPFTEDPETEVLIGTVNVVMQPLAYHVEFKEQMDVTNYKGTEIGKIFIELAPCDAKGKEYTENDDAFVDSPQQLLGTEAHFKVKVVNVRGIPKHYTDVFCKYKFYLDNEETVTQKVSDTSNPDFNHVKLFSFNPVTQQLIDYLSKESLIIHVMGKPKTKKSAQNKSKGLTTKDLLKTDRDVFSKTANLMNGFNLNGRNVDPQKQSLIVELLLMKKTQVRLQGKLDSVKSLIEKADSQGRKSIPTPLLKEIMDANSPEATEGMIQRLEDFPDDDSGYAAPSRPPSSSNSSSFCSIL